MKQQNVVLQWDFTSSRISFVSAWKGVSCSSSLGSQTPFAVENLSDDRSHHECETEMCCQRQIKVRSAVNPELKG